MAPSRVVGFGENVAGRSHAAKRPRMRTGILARPTCLSSRRSLSGLTWRMTVYSLRSAPPEHFPRWASKMAHARDRLRNRVPFAVNLCVVLLQSSWGVEASRGNPLILESPFILADPLPFLPKHSACAGSGPVRQVRHGHTPFSFFSPRRQVKFKARSA